MSDAEIKEDWNALFAREDERRNDSQLRNLPTFTTFGGYHLFFPQQLPGCVVVTVLVPIDALRTARAAAAWPNQLVNGQMRCHREVTLSQSLWHPNRLPTLLRRPFASSCRLAWQMLPALSIPNV